MHVTCGLLELLQGLVTVVDEDILVIDMVAGQQQANWSGKGQTAITSVGGQSLKAVVRRYFSWQVFRLRQGMKGRLRDRLDSLPPRVRLKVVLVMFGLFALCSLYMIGSAIINFGNGKTSNIEVEHIKSVKLPTDKGQQVTTQNELTHGEGEE